MDEPDIRAKSRLDDRISLVLLLSIILIITVVQTQYVGDFTIYAEKMSERRTTLHDAILKNERPAHGWQKKAAQTRIT